MEKREISKPTTDKQAKIRFLVKVGLGNIAKNATKPVIEHG